MQHSTKNKSNVKLVVKLEEKSRAHQSLETSSYWDCEFLDNPSSTFWDSIDCQPYRPTLPSLQSLTASVAKNEERKSQTTLFCEALPHRCLGDTSVTFVTYSYFMWWQYSASALYIEHFYNNFSTKKNGRVFIAAPFCDSGWWGGCYFDRNILPVLALTTPVVEFVWICCHVISFCSNYSQLIGKRKRVYSNHYANVVLTRDAQISPELKPGIQQCCLCSQTTDQKNEYL